MYCQRKDLIDRLGETGVLFVSDDNADGVASVAEMTASLDAAIVAAAVEIDACLAPHLLLPLEIDNAWLRHRAIDLAVEHLAQRKGGSVPDSLIVAATRTRKWLDLVRGGELRVPGLEYPSDRFLDERRSAGLPRLCNPLPPKPRRT